MKIKTNTKQLVLALVLLVSSTFALTPKPTPWSTMFSQVSETNQFGKSLANLIQMHITALDVNSRVQEIADLLNDLHADMITVNENELARIENLRAQCASDIANLNKQLTNANGQLTDYTKERTELLEEQSQKQTALREEKDNYQSMQEDLAQAQKDLEVENQQFERKQNDYNSLIIACEAGIDLLTHMVHGEINYGRNGNSFIQLAQMKDNFAAILTQFKQHSNGAMLEPILSSFIAVSASNKINYEEFMQCIELLRDILARLKQDLTLLTNRHNQIVEDLNTLITKLIDWIRISGEIIDIYEERLREIATRLPELDDLIKEVNVLISTLSQDLSDTQEDCNRENELYAVAQQQRDANLAVMEKLRQYFEEQVRTNVSNVRNDAIE